MQSIQSFFRELGRQAASVLQDLADFAVYVFDPNSGLWPKAIAGGIFFLVVLLVVTKASKAK